MKIEYNGVLYNTDTAKKLGEWHNDAEPTSTYYCEETLYIRRGLRNYFLYGRGGSTSKYATAGKNGWEAGEAIIPLTDFGAEKWLARKSGKKIEIKEIEI